MEWLQFLFGTPRRFRNTAATILGLAIINWLFPHLFEKLIGGLIQGVLTALNPFIGLAMLIFILCVVYRIILSPFFQAKRKKK